MMMQYPNRVIVEAKPTWSLAWGLYWRMIILQLAFIIPIYIIVLIVYMAV